MSNRKTVSIEIGADRIRAVELLNGRKYMNVFNVLEFDTPSGCVDNGYITNPEKLGEILRSYLSEAGIVTTDAVFSVISEDILVGGAEIPRSRKKETESRIREKAQEIFGLAGPRKAAEAGPDDEEISTPKNQEDGSEAETNYQNVGNVTGISIDDYYTAYVEQDDSFNEWNMNLILYAAPSDLIDSYYRLAEYAQLHVLAADFSGNSIFQWMCRAFSRDAVMMVDLRRRGSTATILTEGILRVQVDLVSRTDILADTIVESEKVAEMEDFEDDTSGAIYGEDRIRTQAAPLIEEVNAIASEFLTENLEEYIDTIVISTGGQGSLLVARLIEEKTGIETLILDDLPKGSLVKDEGPFEDMDPGNYLGVLGAIIDPLSFRPPEESAEHLASRRNDLITRILMILVIVSLIVTAALCVTYFILRSHNKALNSNLDKLKYIEDIYEEYQEAEQNNSEIRSLDKLTKQKNELLSQLFSDLEDKIPSDSKITSMSSSDDLVTFSVNAGSKETAAQFIMQLRKIDYLTDIDVSDLTDTKNSAGYNSVDFTVSAYLSGEASSDDPESSDGANDDGISSGHQSEGSDREDQDEENDSSNSSDAMGQTVSYHTQDA